MIEREVINKLGSSNASAPKGSNEAIGKNARIRLLRTSDPYTKLTHGSEGTVTGTYKDDSGYTKIEVQWDSGSSLALIDGVDDYEYWYPYQRKERAKDW